MVAPARVSKAGGAGGGLVGKELGDAECAGCRHVWKVGSWGPAVLSWDRTAQSLQCAALARRSRVHYLRDTAQPSCPLLLQGPSAAPSPAHLALMIHIVKVLARAGLWALALSVGDAPAPTAGPGPGGPRQGQGPSPERPARQPHLRPEPEVASGHVVAAQHEYTSSRGRGLAFWVPATAADLDRPGRPFPASRTAGMFFLFWACESSPPCRQAGESVAGRAA